MEVQRALEDCLPELETLLEHKILSQEEIRSLVSKRREFESRLHRFQVLKEDYLEYISYEVNLNKLVEMRRLKLKSPPQAYDRKRFEQKVNFLFDQCLRKFKGDLNMWVAAIEFAQLKENTSRVSSLCAQGIRFFPTQELFWILSAKHEWEKFGNIKQSRQVFMTALKFLPKSTSLWLEYFRMEFLFVNQVLERRVVQKLEIVSTHDEILKTVYRHAIEAIPHNKEFRTLLLEVAQLFSQETAASQETGKLLCQFISQDIAQTFVPVDDDVADEEEENEESTKRLKSEDESYVSKLISSLTPSALIKELESTVVNRVSQTCFQTWWDEKPAELSVEEVKRVVKLWVHRYPCQESFQHLIELESDAEKKKQLVLQACAQVKAFAV